jgi:hypothetical protein
MTKFTYLFFCVLAAIVLASEHVVAVERKVGRVRGFGFAIQGGSSSRTRSLTRSHPLLMTVGPGSWNEQPQRRRR